MSAAEIPAWVDDALCAQTDPELFFPEKGGWSRAARKVCERCRVTAECLEDALADPERPGIWGGTSYVERRRIRQQRAEEVA